MGHPPERIAEAAEAWNALRSLLASGYHRRPDPARRAEGAGYKKGWEVRLTAATPGAAEQVTALLHRLGVRPGRPFAKHDRIVVPVYGRRHQWLGRLLDLEHAAEVAPRDVAAVAPPPRRRPALGQALLDFIVADRSWRRSAWRGRGVWAGRCLRCEDLLLVELDGRPISGLASVDLAPDERALVCAPCGEVARTAFRRAESDPRRVALLEHLRRRRSERAGDS